MSSETVTVKKASFEKLQQLITEALKIVQEDHKSE